MKFKWHYMTSTNFRYKKKHQAQSSYNVKRKKNPPPFYWVKITLKLIILKITHLFNINDLTHSFHRSGPPCFFGCFFFETCFVGIVSLNNRCFWTFIFNFKSVAGPNGLYTSNVALNYNNEWMCFLYFFTFFIGTL